MSGGSSCCCSAPWTRCLVGFNLVVGGGGRRLLLQRTLDMMWRELAVGMEDSLLRDWGGVGIGRDGRVSAFSCAAALCHSSGWPGAGGQFGRQ